jgi:colanic acid biosynthesis glycosyl transferase WcaI
LNRCSPRILQGAIKTTHFALENSALRILVVTPYYPPDLGPSAPLVGMLCDDLVKRGHKATVVTMVPHFPSGRVKREYRKRLVTWEQSENARVCRIWIPSGSRARLMHRLAGFLIYQIVSSLVCLRLSFDVALVTNPAIETFLQFVAISILRKRPILYAVWDLYPDVGVALGVFRHKYLVWLVRRLEYFCLERSTAIQVLAKGFVAPLAQRVSNSKKIVIIPVWVDTDFVHPLEGNNGFSEEMGLAGRSVVLYAGNLGLSQGLESVLETAARLQKRNDIEFVFVGDGPARDALHQEASRLQLSHVRFIDFKPHFRLPEVLASADIALVTQKREVSDLSIPSKAFPILASGRPIVAVSDEGSDLFKLIHESQAGVCVVPNDGEALTTAISDLLAAPKVREDMSRRGREFAVQNHSREVAAKKFESILARILAESTS